MIVKIGTRLRTRRADSAHHRRRRRAIAIALLGGLALGAGPRAECPEVASSPIPRFEAATVVVGDKLYVLGGFNAALDAYSRSDVYDPAADTWTRIADLPTPVTHAGVAVDENSIWLAGGFVGNHPGEATDAVWRYDITADRWDSQTPLPEARASAPLVRVERGLHYFGGIESDRWTDASDHWRLDLESPTAWTARAALPEARNHLGGIELGGKIFAIGGQLGHDRNPVDIAPVHEYDPASDTWRARAPLPFGRSHFEPGTFKVGNQIVIVGGRANELGLDALEHVTAYDAARDAWREIASIDAPLRAPTAAVVGDRVFIGLGGSLPGGSTARAIFRVCELQELGLGSSGAYCGDPSTPPGSAEGAPSTGDAVTASDALATLQASVGVSVCPMCVCDVDDSGSVTATDALVLLQYAVGKVVPLACPAC